MNWIVWNSYKWNCILFEDNRRCIPTSCILWQVPRLGSRKSMESPNGHFLTLCPWPMTYDLEPDLVILLSEVDAKTQVCMSVRSAVRDTPWHAQTDKQRMSNRGCQNYYNRHIRDEGVKTTDLFLTFDNSWHGFTVTVGLVVRNPSLIDALLKMRHFTRFYCCNHFLYWDPSRCKILYIHSKPYITKKLQNLTISTMSK